MDEITGTDASGNEIRGNRELSVGDLGAGGENQPTSEIELYGGPLDGMRATTVTPTREFTPLLIVDKTGTLHQDELYLARWVDGVLFGVWAEALQEYFRSDEFQGRDPDPDRMRSISGDEFRLEVPMCERGTHVWGPWRTTPGGNHTRICMKCMTSQANILG
jgi:hypothetical protein